MARFIHDRKGVWNLEQRRRTLAAANHIRKTLISMRSKLLNSVTLTSIPRYLEGVEPGQAATSCVIDYPKNSLPTDGQLFPLSSKDLAASVNNETAVQLESLLVTSRFDIHGDRARSMEKDILSTKDITVGELIEDMASYLRLLQDRPLGAEEDFMVVSMAPRDSYCSVPRDRVSSLDIRERTGPEKKFMAKNFVLGVRNNVSDRDIEMAVLANVDGLAKLNNVPFPDDQVSMAKSIRSRFRAATVAHAVANLREAELGTEKQLFKVQPLEDMKVS